MCYIRRRFLRGGVSLYWHTKYPSVLLVVTEYNWHCARINNKCGSRSSHGDGGYTRRCTVVGMKLQLDVVDVSPSKCCVRRHIASGGGVGIG